MKIRLAALFVCFLVLVGANTPKEQNFSGEEITIAITVLLWVLVFLDGEYEFLYVIIAIIALPFCVMGAINGNDFMVNITGPFTTMFLAEMVVFTINYILGRE